MTQIIVERWQCELEVQTQVARLFVNLDITDVPPKLILIFSDRHIPIVIVSRNTETCSSHQIF